MKPLRTTLRHWSEAGVAFEAVVLSHAAFSAAARALRRKRDQNGDQLSRRRIVAAIEERLIASGDDWIRGAELREMPDGHAWIRVVAQQKRTGNQQVKCSSADRHPMRLVD